jgi:predicted RNA binding protein with dsRBD fold (UPF0201 family)
MEKSTTQFTIQLKSKIKPTEDREKVIKAIKNIFTDAEITIPETDKIYITVEGEAKNIERFKELIRSQAILDTARSVLEKGSKGNYTKFKINKQAAYSEVVNFDKDIHGGIYVKIICSDEDKLINAIKDIAPRTKYGKIINEDEEEKKE